MSAPGKPSALIKPTLDTQFYVDYSWWDREHVNEDLTTYLLSHLLPEQRERLQGAERREVDFIDPHTGEISQLDDLNLALRIAAQDPNFINPQTSLVDSVFRVFIANNNQPLSPRQLAERTGRDAPTILRTLSGTQIYKGIRPYQPSDEQKK